MPRLLLGALAPAAALLGAFVIATAARAATPVGAEFQVNTYTTSVQGFPSVALDADGDFVVVWDGDSSAGSYDFNYSIHGQRYDSSGNTAGAEFQVNTYTTSYQYSPSISLDANGDFVVVWYGIGSPGSDTDFSIQGQRYDATGGVVGSQFQVNTYTTSYQTRPKVSLDADGDFVVVWSSLGSAGSDTSFGSIHGQRYDSSGNTAGAEFQVNSYTTSYQYSPSVAVDSDGDFVVVWHSFGSFGSDDDIASVQGQRYDASGSTVGSEFQVNTYTTSYQGYPSVAVDSDGDFVVVWHSLGSFGSDDDIASVQGQRYDSSGSTVGAQFQVNTYTPSNQAFPWISLDADGDFVVVWRSDESAGSDSSSYSIQGQRYDASGNTVGSEFQVNTYTTSRQDIPAVALDADGDFVVVWDSDGSAGTDSDDRSIQAQRYLPEPSEFLMLGAGIAFLAALGRRRIKA